MTATFFAVAGKPGGRNDWDADQGTPQVRLMDEDELRKLTVLGFELGSHSFHHVKFRESPSSTIDQELQQSRHAIEQATGKPVRFLAYPYGEYPRNHGQHARQAGYAGAVSIFSRAATVLADPFCMRRILVHQGDGKSRFRFKLSCAYLWLRPWVDRRVSHY
jgi:peptidoglycan/xylan/chitin deacetylase (PgdA/CDA1 family)